MPEWLAWLMLIIGAIICVWIIGYVVESDYFSQCSEEYYKKHRYFKFKR